MSRHARVERKTLDSHVVVELDLDGTGDSSAHTGVPFFDQLVAEFGKHGGFDLTVRTQGDEYVDASRTVEDTSAALGDALREALGDRSDLRRFGDAVVPLDETLVQAAVDVSGRPFCVVVQPELVEIIGTYDTALTRVVFESIAAGARIALHVRVLAGSTPHHVVEAEFTALARALRDAVAFDGRPEGPCDPRGTAAPLTPTQGGR